MTVRWCVVSTVVFLIVASMDGLYAQLDRDQSDLAQINFSILKREATAVVDVVRAFLVVPSSRTRLALSIPMRFVIRDS